MNRWENIVVGEEIIEYIKKNNIKNYAAFLMYCSKNNKKWFKKMCDTPNMRKYFKN